MGIYFIHSIHLPNTLLEAHEPAQPIMWQQYKTLIHTDMDHKGSVNVYQKAEMCNLSDCSLVISIRWTGLSISETAVLLGQQSRGFIQNSVEKKNIQF